jgi:signal transduction histidine kinase
MTLSTTTIVVLASNGLMAVVAMALLMLVLWQDARRRMNQYFAAAMLLLAAYGVTNGFGRFIDPLGLNATRATYAAVSLYGIFIVLVFFFASEFALSHLLAVRVMRILGLALVITSNVALWNRSLMTNIRPTGAGDGSYQGDWTALGRVTMLAALLYLIVSAVVLYRMPDERGRSMWKAPVLMIAAAISATFIWPAAHIPLQAIFLATTALVLGIPVLRYELFNPLAELNAELARKNIELHESNRMKSQFLANISHELRTPLNSIIGYTELICNGTYGALNDTQRDRLQKVIRNGYNLLALVNDVLDLNRIETGRATLERRTITTGPLLDSVLDTIAPLATRKGLIITRDFSDAPPVFADETRLRQIVTNIVSNAVKFTQQGGVTVRAFGANDMVRFEFADTGVGIAPDQYDKVFEEFQQLENTVTREYEGTGLGMAITKKLVELHGGRIWLESMPGRGTTFFVTLPVARDRVSRYETLVHVEQP